MNHPALLGRVTDSHEALLGFRFAAHTEKVRVSLYLTAFMGDRPYFDVHMTSKEQTEFKMVRIRSSTSRTFVSVDCVPRPDGVVELCLHMPTIKSKTEAPTFDPRGLDVGLFYLVANPIR